MAKTTPIDESIIARVVNGVKYVVSGVTPDSWFSPNQPIAPIAQEDAVGRRYQFPVGFNTRIVPRSEERTSFAELRGLAENLDILRAVIETRKDQICMLQPLVRYKDGRADDQRIKNIQSFFEFPDQEHDWPTWIRAILEDMFVIDAPTLYPVLTKQTKTLTSIELIDGATIKLVIDEKGRTPKPPSVAYQQILYGVPAVDYNKDELIYFPRNVRTHKLYGYSPVEQIIMTVNIALRRQIAQLQYYTEGNIPDAIMSAPENWNVDQIKQFQEYWDSILEGNTAARRHAKFVPHGVLFHQTRENPIKDEFDEWLARVVCYAFNINPQSFVRQMNRATAEVAQDTATQEGLQPIKQWVCRLHNYIIAKYFNAPDVEFSFKEAEDIDLLRQAQINKIYLEAGVKDINEVRVEIGLEPKKEQLQIEAQKIAKNNNNIEDEIFAFLDEVKEDIIGQVAKQYDSNKNADEIVMALNFAGFAEFNDKLVSRLEKAYQEATSGAFKSLQEAKELDDMAYKAAYDYAKTRAADLVGINPNSKFALTDSTREMLKADIAKAIENNMSVSELKELLQENYAFSKSRAETIARTEMSKAASEGKITAWKTSDKVIGKRYVMSATHPKADVCDMAAKMGVVPIDSDFGGIGNAPAHPNCQCHIEPEIRSE